MPEDGATQEGVFAGMLQSLEGKEAVRVAHVEDADWHNVSGDGAETGCANNEAEAGIAETKGEWHGTEKTETIEVEPQDQHCQQGRSVER